MPGFKEWIASKGPTIAMAMLAAQRAGPQAAAAFLQGLQDRAARESAAQAQQEALARQGRLDTAAEEERVFARENVEADNARAERAQAMTAEQQDFARAQSAIEALDPMLETPAETAPPMSVAVLAGTTGADTIAATPGLPQGALAPFVVGMSRRRRS